MRAAESDSPRRILFVPQGGRGGTGEYARLLSLAHASRRRWPGLHASFATKQTTPRHDDDPYDRYLLPREPRGGAIERVLWATAPDVAVFNNTGKGPELAAARRAGARVVYVGSVPHYRRRGFRRELLRQMDAFWIFPADDTDRRLTPREEEHWRRSGRPPLHFLESVFAPPDPQRAAGSLASLGIESDGYALFVPGGGGWTPRGRPCSQLFVEAAGETARRTGMPSLVVLGPMQREAPPAPNGVTLIGYLPQGELMDLIAGARVVATGGGGLLNQALALGAVCVATPLQEGDQPHRVAECAERGLLLAAEPEPGEIAEPLCELFRNEPRRAKIRARLAESGPRNELERCMGLLAPLVDAGARRCPIWLRPVRPLRR